MRPRRRRDPEERMRGEIPTPVLILIGVISFGLICLILIWLIFTESGRYQPPEDETPAYPSRQDYRTINENYYRKLQQIQDKESQFQDQAVKNFDRASLQTQDRIKQLELKKNFSKKLLFN